MLSIPMGIQARDQATTILTSNAYRTQVHFPHLLTKYHTVSILCTPLQSKDLALSICSLKRKARCAEEMPSLSMDAPAAPLETIQILQLLVALLDVS